MLRPSLIETPRSRVYMAITVALMAAAFIGTRWAIGDGRFWLLVPILGIPLIGILWLRRGFSAEYRRGRELELRRFEELEQQELTQGASFEIRGRWPFALSASVSAIFVLMLAGGLWTREVPLFLLAAFISVPALALIWWLAYRQSRHVYATLDTRGVRIGEDEIPWSQVAGLDLEREYRGARFLVFALQSPAEPRSFQSRLNSWLSRGRSDREIRIRVDQVRETPGIVYEIAYGLWSGAVGKFNAERSARATLDRGLAELRPLSRRPATERRRTYIALAGMAVLSAFCVHGILTDFVVSAAWWWPSLWLAVVCTGGGFWLLLRRRGLTVHNRSSTTLYLLMVLFVIAFTSSGTWMVVGRSLPDLATRVLGGPDRLSVKFGKRGGHDRYCHTKLQLYFDGRKFPTPLCVAPAFFDALPESGQLQVTGRRSWFGLHIDDLALEDPTWHR